MGRAPAGRGGARGGDDPDSAMRAPSSETPKRILVADDHEDTLSFMQAALEKAGYEVQTAQDGAQAVALQRKRSADLLITDIFMPEQDGIETLSQFRTHFPETKIIAISAGGTSTRDYLASAALHGADATLRKPFDADQLLDTVRRVLQAR